MSDTSRIRVNLSAVEANIRIVRDIVGGDCALCPVVKADAYGLGAAPIARHLKAAGAEMLAVYTPAQAAALARAAVGGPILVLQPVHELARIDEAYRLLIRGDLHLTVHDAGHLDRLMRLAEGFATLIPVHVEIDTGMCRGGCSPDQAPSIIKRISAHRLLRLAGISTHFAAVATDEEFTDRQLALFERVVEQSASDTPPDCLMHAANTLAVLRHKRFHKSMVRVGQAWAGYGPEAMPSGAAARQAAALRPVVTWKSQIVHVKTIERGTRVGYGRAWTARRRSCVGLVPVGYADGFPMGLAATDDAPKPPCVRVEAPAPAPQRRRAAGGEFARVIGQVNMDQMIIDLTDPLRGGLDVGPGTTVELYGADPAAPNHVPALARAAGTIPHELLARLSPRIKRIYHATEAYHPVAGAATAS
jgi:alanine racemase